MRLHLQPVRVAAGEEGEGRLVLQEGQLVAVLVQLSDCHGAQSGWWFLEKGFGPLDGPIHFAFPDLVAAEEWIKARLADVGPTLGA
jgi:hypothetical protein